MAASHSALLGGGSISNRQNAAGVFSQ